MSFSSKDKTTHKSVIVLGNAGHMNDKDEIIVMEQPNNDNLDQQEITFLLELIKNCTFLGAQVELVYNTAVKLQNQFLDLNNKAQ